MPREQLQVETVALAERLMKLNPQAIPRHQAGGEERAQHERDAALDYLAAKSTELRFLDREKGRERGMSQFLDERPTGRVSSPMAGRRKRRRSDGRRGRARKKARR